MFPFYVVSGIDAQMRSIILSRRIPPRETIPVGEESWAGGHSRWKGKPLLLERGVIPTGMVRMLTCISNTQFQREGVSKESDKYTVKRRRQMVDFHAVCSELSSNVATFLNMCLL